MSPIETIINKVYENVMDLIVDIESWLLPEVMFLFGSFLFDYLQVLKNWLSSGNTCTVDSIKERVYRLCVDIPDDPFKLKSVTVNGIETVMINIIPVNHEIVY